MTRAAAEMEAALAPEFELLRPLGVGGDQHGVAGAGNGAAPARRHQGPAAELALDEEVRGRFEREARAAARLRHPGITAIHRIARLPDGSPYLVMEYVDGRTLADLLRAEGPMAKEPAIEALAQVAEALAEAHENGVIHRDVRPGNVISAAPRPRHPPGRGSCDGCSPPSGSSSASSWPRSSAGGS